ncbi:MAG: DUF4276 family protein [Bacteroidia bacterium]
MVKVGLISESQYDHEALRILLMKIYSNIQVIRLLHRYPGHNLDSVKALGALEIDFRTQKPILVIVQRDLDTPPSNSKQRKIRDEYFQQVNGIVNKLSIPLLHIQEIEALILADTTSFNKRYKVNLNYTRNPEHQDKPKEFLKSKSGRKGYIEAHAPELISEIDIEKVRKKLNYFDNFLNQFETALQSA